MSSGPQRKSFSFRNSVAIDGKNLLAATLNSSIEFIITVPDFTYLNTTFFIVPPIPSIAPLP